MYDFTTEPHQPLQDLPDTMRAAADLSCACTIVYNRKGEAFWVTNSGRDVITLAHIDTGEVHSASIETFAAQYDTSSSGG